MNDNPHRSIQNLPKIGPVFSTKDEKQRVISEEILSLKFKPELKLRLNMNIPGLDRKKQISTRNPSTFRFFAPLSTRGKEGWVYLWTMPNITRFWTPFMCVLLLYYSGESFVTQVYGHRDVNNYEWETTYVKMQTFPSHYFERWSLMA